MGILNQEGTRASEASAIRPSAILEKGKMFMVTKVLHLFIWRTYEKRILQ